MKHNFNIQPAVWNETPLVFDWDDETGAVTGPDAQRIIEVSTWGTVDAHPCPWEWNLGPEPLKSKTDMAAIIGRRHHLPEALAAFYPQLPDDGFPDVSYTDADGVFVVGRDLITY